MRVLLLPGGNALSHLAKALAIRKALLAAGHEAVLAASSSRSPFLSSLDIPHHTVEDLQESDGGPAPAFTWFRQPARFRRVVTSEVALIRDLAPDRVLSVFRFTTPTAAQVAEVPCDTLACGCMIPAFEGVLGFRAGEPGITEQQRFLDIFYRNSATRLSLALKDLGLPTVADLRALLVGRRTFLWDTPTFEPLPPSPDRIHVGPLSWTDWPSCDEDQRALDRLRDPLAVLSFGTAPQADMPEGRLLARLVALGFHVAVAGGGRLPGGTQHPHVTHLRYAPMDLLLARAELLVCHGGQQTLFEARAHGVPAAVLPFHPEQAQNARCMEALGAGASLLPPTVFWGSSQVYADALTRMNDDELDRRLRGLAGRREPCRDPLLQGAAARLVAAL